MLDSILTTVGNVLAIILGIIAFAAPLWLPAAKAWLNKRVVAGIEQNMALQVKEFEHRLHMAAASAQFDFQRRMTDFDLYASKRHQTYAELWKLLRSAHGRILDIGRLREQGFEYFDADDVERYLKKRELPSGKTAQILAIWAEDQARGVSALNEVVRSLTIHEALAAFILANNAFTEGELYLSQVATKKTQDVLYQLESLRVALADPETANDIQTSVLRHETNTELQALKGLLRDDLSRGDYAESVEAAHLLRVSDQPGRSLIQGH